MADDRRSALLRVLHDDGLRRRDLLATHLKCWLTFSVRALPPAFLDGIREGGVVVAPVGPPADQRLIRYRRQADTLREDDLGAVRFVGARPLIED